MKYRAVIFDLFGTLIDNSSRAEYERVLEQMAVVLEVPPVEFTRLWFGTFNERTTGILHSPEGNIIYICQKLGVGVTEMQVKEASRIRSRFTRDSMVPRAGSLETLKVLKSRGLKTGLITDCSGEVPVFWSETPFASLIDTAVFSCTAGVKKPDPRIYRIAMEQLGVQPGDCLYIGDGSSRELTGARQVGMCPVLIRVPYEAGPDSYRIDEEEWGGEVISALAEVLDLV